MTTPTFTWTIPTVERELSTGRVTVVHWRLSATDGTNTATAYSTVSLPPKDPTDPTFVSYDKLTEDEAIQWAQGALGADQVTAYEVSLTAQLSALANPTEGAGVPW
jgi:hypothetical protein